MERLVPYEHNARTHSSAQIEQIALSMEQFDFTNPILVDGQSGILAGHARLCAARSLNFEKVPVIVLDHFTDIQKRAYITGKDATLDGDGRSFQEVSAERITITSQADSPELNGSTGSGPVGGGPGSDGHG